MLNVLSCDGVVCLKADAEFVALIEPSGFGILRLAEGFRVTSTCWKMMQEILDSLFRLANVQQESQVLWSSHRYRRVPKTGVVRLDERRDGLGRCAPIVNKK